mmetsp:Transcript_9473/g.34753  ORF Transcript_9473/g.34753 Transcript_9473/m.34753 type:complete len:693 (-) Transcript_9473:341-2419(-)
MQMALQPAMAAHRLASGIASGPACAGRHSPPSVAGRRRLVMLRMSSPTAPATRKSDSSLLSSAKCWTVTRQAESKPYGRSPIVRRRHGTRVHRPLLVMSGEGARTTEQKSSETRDKELSEDPLPPSVRVQRLQNLGRLRRLYRHILQAEKLKSQTALQASREKRLRMDSQRSRGTVTEKAALNIETAQHKLQQLCEGISTMASLMEEDLNDLEGILESLFSDPGDARIVRQFTKEKARSYRHFRQKTLNELPAEILIQRETSGEASPEDKGLLSSRIKIDAQQVKGAVEQLQRTVSDEEFVSGLRNEVVGFRDWLAQMLHTVKEWLAGVWARLNGREGFESMSLPAILPLPVKKSSALEAERGDRMKETDEVERQLRNASRDRDKLLRDSRDRLARARLAGDIRELDERVSELRRALAVRTLQLEMLRIYAALEVEAAQFTETTARSEREGELLLAEYEVLEQKLGVLIQVVDEGRAYSIVDEELTVLAVEIPDLRQRMGIEEVLPELVAAEDNLLRVQLRTREALGKVKLGVEFYSRGTRILASDVLYSFSLIWRAILGSTLKPREVKTIRRTFRDCLTLIPSAIILIIPLTPLGHVLVFSLIQRVFPDFFPTPFTQRRQDIMLRYEQLETALANETQYSEDERKNRRRVALQAALSEDERAMSKLIGDSKDDEDDKGDGSGKTGGGNSDS